MIKIESLKNYIGKDSFEEITKQIYNITDFSSDYPDYESWFFSKQIPRVLEKTGEIFFAKSIEDNTIIGIASLKKTDKEKKICNLFVKEEYRSIGIGTKLLTSSMEFLETSKPFITIRDYNLSSFKPFIDKYNWELVEVATEIYGNNTKEFCYNGKLIKEKITKNN